MRGKRPCFYRKTAGKVLNTPAEYIVIEGWGKMNAWKNVYGEGLKVRYHIFGVEDGIESDFVDKIEIVSEDGYELLLKYYAEEGILFINYNGNKIWFYSPAPGFTYLHNLAELSAEEIVSLVRHEISYLLSLALS